MSLQRQNFSPCSLRPWVLVRAGVSLRSKRFRLVSGQRNTEEGDFRFWPREKWNENQKVKEGGGGGEGRKRSFPFFLPHPLPGLLLAPLFSRSLTLVPRSFLLNRTETLATQARPGFETATSRSADRRFSVELTRRRSTEVEASCNFRAENHR